MTSSHDPIAVSDRFVALFAERAVPAVRQRRMFDTWALEEAEPSDVEELLEGADGEVRLCWDGTVVIYQERGDSVCHVRAVPVRRDRVVEGMRTWAARTVPPLRDSAQRDEDVALDMFGPHPSGDVTHVLLSFAVDPEDPRIVEAYASVAWTREEEP